MDSVFKVFHGRKLYYETHNRDLVLSELSKCAPTWLQKTIVIEEDAAGWWGLIVPCVKKPVKRIDNILTNNIAGLIP